MRDFVPYYKVQSRDTKNIFLHLAVQNKSCSIVYVLVFLMSSSLTLVEVFVCDHTPWYKTWLAVLHKVSICF